MMPQSHSVRRCFLSALVSSALLAGALATTAQADSYGELQHFGSAGKGLGQFETAEAHVLGVDPTDNSVYVGDAPKKEGEFRIQKLTPGALGEYEKNGKPVSDATISFDVGKEITGIESPELEGIAVDPQQERVYALVVAEREELAVDPAEQAAAAIYEFSTKAEGSTLKGSQLVGPAALKTQSPTQGEALLSPAGITVDPVSHDVIILGTVDQGPDAQGAARERVVLQRVHANGTLGSRYVDQTACFEGEGSAECEEVSGSPTSPVVTPTGRVYVQTNNELWEVPTAENKGTKELEFVAQPPKLAFDFIPPDPLQILVNFPGTPLQGGGLSFVSEGASEGTVWAFARIKEDIGPEGEKRTGALALKWSEHVAGKPEFAEEGWTGGASASESSCKITGSERDVAGGKGHTVFVFDASNAAPRVVEFGPGGKGCPHTKAGPMKAQVRGEEVGTKAVPAHTADEVTLESTLTQGYARAVKWDFGDGETAESHATEYPTTKRVHKFKGAGEHTVKETIETDDLAEPTITVSRTVLVSPSPPTAQFSYPLEVPVGQAATFEAGNSSDPNGSPITQYIWNFGDGTQTTSSTPTVAHAYGSASSPTVTLEVVDALGLHSAVISHVLNVVTPSSGGGGGGGGGTGNPGSGGGTGGGSGPGGGPAPSGGVLSYQVKLAGTSVAVSPAGVLAIKVSCAGQSSCTGTVTLRTLGAVSAAAGKHKTVLTLASGSFTLAGGHAKLVTLHLSSKAKKLLAKTHVLHVRATIVARDQAGVTHTTQATLTLKAVKAKH